MKTPSLAAPRPAWHISRMIRAVSLSLYLALLCACTQFPELDATVPEHGNDVQYPALVPLGPLLSNATTRPPDTAAAQSNLTARVSALRARAARLRGPVLDASTRARMRAGVTPS